MAPTDPFAGILGSFNSALNLLHDGVTNIRNGWDKLTAAIEAFIAAVNKKLSEDHWWSKVAEWFTDAVQDALKSFQEKIKEVQDFFDKIFDRLQKALNGGTPVLSLMAAGSDWTQKVEPKLSEITGNMKQSGKIDSWHGPAHDTYKTREEDHLGAVSQTVEEVKNVSNWLTGVAKANVEFMSELVTQVSPIFNKLTETTGDVAEAATTADVLSAQEAANDASSTLGSIAEAIINYLTTLANRLADVVGMVNAQATDTNDYSNFPGEKWPQAVNS